MWDRAWKNSIKVFGLGEEQQETEDVTVTDKMKEVSSRSFGYVVIVNVLVVKFVKVLRLGEKQQRMERTCDCIQDESLFDFGLMVERDGVFYEIHVWYGLC